MEYKESLEKQDNDRDPNNVEHNEEEEISFEIVINDLFSTYEENNSTKLSEIIETFLNCLHTIKEKPLDMFMEKNLLGFFISVLGNKGYANCYINIINSLILLASFIDLNLEPLITEEAFEIYETVAFPIINDLVLQFTFYDSILNSNIPGSITFFKAGLLNKVFEVLLNDEIDIEIKDKAIKLIATVLFSIFPQYNEDEIFQKILHDLTTFILSISHQVQTFSANMLYAAYACLTLSSETTILMIQEFPLEILYNSFQNNDKNTERIIIVIVKTLVTSGDPRFFEKWDFSPFFSVIHDKYEETMMMFIDLCTDLCNLYVSFARYLFESETIKFFFSAIEDAPFNIKERALKTISAVFKHENRDYIIKLLEMGFIDVISGFLSLDSGSFLSQCVVALTNILMFATTNAEIGELILKLFDDNDTINILEEILQNTTNEDLIADIEIFLENYKMIFPNDEEM